MNYDDTIQVGDYVKVAMWKGIFLVVEKKQRENNNPLLTVQRKYKDDLTPCSHGKTTVDIYWCEEASNFLDREIMDLSRKLKRMKNLKKSLTEG